MVFWMEHYDKNKQRGMQVLHGNVGRDLFIVFL